jgi:DNA-directed RNA polymerase subunit K/omega
MSDYEDSDELDISEELAENLDKTEAEDIQEDSEGEEGDDGDEEEDVDKLEEEIEAMEAYDDGVTDATGNPVNDLNVKTLQNLRRELINDKVHKISYVVADDDRITSDYIQLHEMTEAIGIRASQIENGSPVLIDTSHLRIADPITLATLEFYKRKSPLILKRVVRESETEEYIEKWKVREMKFYVHNITFRDYIEKLAPESAKKPIKGSFESFVSYDSDLAF